MTTLPHCHTLESWLGNRSRMIPGVWTYENNVIATIGDLFIVIVYHGHSPEQSTFVFEAAYSTTRHLFQNDFRDSLLSRIFWQRIKWSQQHLWRRGVGHPNSLSVTTLWCSGRLHCTGDICSCHVVGPRISKCRSCRVLVAVHVLRTAFRLWVLKESLQGI